MSKLNRLQHLATPQAPGKDSKMHPTMWRATTDDSQLLNIFAGVWERLGGLANMRKPWKSPQTYKCAQIYKSAQTYKSAQNLG